MMIVESCRNHNGRGILWNFEKRRIDMAKDVANDVLGEFACWQNKLFKYVRDGSFNQEEIKWAVQKIINQKNGGFLGLISDGSLILDAVDEMEILADAKDVFTDIDSGFRNLKIDKTSQLTPEIHIDVYQLVKDADFSRMFDLLSFDTRSLCLKQAQIKAFAKKYRSWLRTGGYATFFLFESEDFFSVAHVYEHFFGRLWLCLHPLDHPIIWSAEYRPRVVIPRLMH